MNPCIQAAIRCVGGKDNPNEMVILYLSIAAFVILIVVEIFVINILERRKPGDD